MNASSRCRTIIKRHEGFAPAPYRCPAGKPTIGYGHVIRPHESFPDNLTRGMADELLREDLKAAERAVGLYVVVPLSQNQFDALSSFIFNVGPKAFAVSTLRMKLNHGDYAGAAAEFDRWIYVNKKKLPGLIARRAAERELFLLKAEG
jgi:lysozyme